MHTLGQITSIPSLGSHIKLWNSSSESSNLYFQNSMEIEGKKPTSGYGKPPWIFKGSALYQLHLVKSETARAFIPKDFRLVEAFGYTLGGFFLASYDDSPVGRLDELVVIAGIVWNRPTSCAWAARVLVNSDEACAHGRKEFGLPSQVARFSKRTNDMPSTPKKKINGFLNMFSIGTDSCNTKTGMDVQVNEITSHASIGLFTIGTNSTFGETGVPKLNSVQSMGPVMKMSLPSFSGRTEHNPDLLKYSCQIECRVKPTSPAKVARLESEGEHSPQNAGEDQRSLSISVMLSKPILALQFSCLKMQVHPPVILSEASHNPLPH